MHPLNLFFHRAYNSTGDVYHQLLDTELLSPSHFYFFCKSPNETCQANDIALRICREISTESLKVKDIEINNSRIRCYAISQEHSSSFNQIILREGARRTNAAQIFGIENGDCIVIPPATNIFCFDDF